MDLATLRMRVIPMEPKMLIETAPSMRRYSRKIWITRHATACTNVSS